MSLDDKDLSILDELIIDSSQTTKQLSKKLRIPITTVHNRTKKMQESGVIKKYTIEPSYELLGRPIHAYIFISIAYKPGSTSRSQQDIGKEIKRLGATRVSIVTGETDMIAEVHVSDISELNNFVTNKLRFIKGVDQTRTTIVLDELS